MFKNAKFGHRITLSVSLLLLVMLFAGVGAFVYAQYQEFTRDVKEQAGHVLGVVESVHTQAMLNRGDKDDNNPVLDALNGTLEQYNRSAKDYGHDLKLWLVMGPKVEAFQKKTGRKEIEPPRDAVDRDVLKTGASVGRMVAGGIYRYTRPVILGRGVARDEKCLQCHGVDMGMAEGDVIGAYSVGLSVKEQRDEFLRISTYAFFAALLVTFAVLLTNAFLLSRMAGEPITRLTQAMGRLVDGEWVDKIPGRERDDEIGAMARALEIFRENDVKRRRAEIDLLRTRDEMEQRVDNRTRELKEAGQLANAVFVNAAEGIITSDEKGRIETFNPMAENLFGYTADEVIGQNLKVLMASGHARKHDGYIDNYLDTGKGKILGVRERELMARRKDGTLFPFELNVAEFFLGGERKFIGTMRDITNRKKAEEKIRSAAEKQSLLQAVAQAANESRIVEVAMEAALNAVCEHTGWPVGHVYVPSEDDPDVLVSSGLWHLASPERLGGFRRVSESLAFAAGEGLPGRVLENGKPAWITDLPVDKNFPRAELAREIKLASGIAFPILVRGEVAAVMEFFSDIRHEEDQEMLVIMGQIGAQIGQVIERNRALEQLATAMERTELANRAKTEFLANMSHELRTPLNSIIGFSEVVMNEIFGSIENERYAGYVSDIHSSGRHLLELINDILDVSKIEAGAMDLVEEDLDVEEVIWESVRVVKGRAESGEIRLSVSIDSTFPRLRADAVRFKQILLNLLSNAIKFTPKGGSVRIEAELEPGGGLALSITDTGIGVSEDELEKVLQPFTQASSGLDRRHEGTGLGLYLVKALAEEHDGSLDIASRLNHGTTVTVRFPAKRVLPAADQDSPESADRASPEDPPEEKKLAGNDAG